MRLRIIELVVVLFVLACGLTAMRTADPTSESLFFSFTILLLWGGGVLAIGSPPPSRLRWLAFALTGIAYLYLAHLPDEDAIVPRHRGPELTTKLLSYLYAWKTDSLSAAMSDSDTGLLEGPFALPEEATDGFPAQLSLVIGGGQRVVASGDSIAFMRCGHCLLALAFAWLAGHLSSVCYSRGGGTHEERPRQSVGSSGAS